VYNSWEATSFSVSADGQARLAELAAQVGAECFVVDDGWFTGRRHDRAGLGDWVVDRSKFPDGLTPLVGHVNRLGMRFGLWIEPEMVNPDSDLYRAHPDWVYHFANRSRTQQRNQLVLNLARPDVAQWVFDTLDRLLAADNIQFVKWDMNRHFSEPGWPAEAGRNPERVWVEHVRSLYRDPGRPARRPSGRGRRILLRRRGARRPGHPEPGGSGLDLGQHRRVGPHRDPGGLHPGLHPPGDGGLGDRQPEPAHRAAVPAPVPVPLGHGRGARHRRRPDPVEPRRAGRGERPGRHVQGDPPVVQRGRLYRVASVGRDPLGASEDVAADGSRVVLLAWWGPRPAGDPLPPLRLRGMDPGARYQDADTGREHWGAEVMQHGLRLPGDAGFGFGSALVRLARAGGPG
jgi:alpha-galactosidase